MFNRERQIEYLHETLKRCSIVVSPYDAELFGHWWFEGPQFLEVFIRKAALEQKIFRLATPGDFLEKYDHHPSQQPAASTWGAEGYNRVWLNSNNQWLYRHQHWAEDCMIELSNRYRNPGETLQRMLNQAARELLLAQSSDWAFMLSHRTSALYAIKRFRDHIHRFKTLHESIVRQNCDLDWLKEIEERDNLFRDLNYRVFGSDSECDGLGIS